MDEEPLTRQEETMQNIIYSYEVIYSKINKQYNKHALRKGHSVHH